MELARVGVARRSGVRRREIQLRCFIESYPLHEHEQKLEVTPMVPPYWDMSPINRNDGHTTADTSMWISCHRLHVSTIAVVTNSFYSMRQRNWE